MTNVKNNNFCSKLLCNPESNKIEQWTILVSSKLSQILRQPIVKIVYPLIGEIKRVNLPLIVNTIINCLIKN